MKGRSADGTTHHIRTPRPNKTRHPAACDLSLVVVQVPDGVALSCFECLGLVLVNDAGSYLVGGDAA